MRHVIPILILAGPAFAQGGLATPVNPPPGFPNFYNRPVRPLPVPLRPPVVGPGYYPIIYPGYGWGGGYGAAPVTNVTIIERVEVPPAAPVPPLHPAYLSTAAAARRRAEVSATVIERTEFTLTLPAAGTVWLDGAKQAGTGPEFVLAVPPGKACAVRAEWQQGGKTYEYTRTVTLDAGDKQAATVFRGDVKK